MKELVDLFAKLVIGTFTFIGPSFTLLISLFSKQLERAKTKIENRIDNLISVEGVKTKSLKKLLSKSERDTNLLNPKRQGIRLFGTLLVSLGLIGLYYYQRSSYWPWPKYWFIRGATLTVSFALYLYCLFVLWQIFCIIISAKHEEEEEAKGRKTALKPKK